MEGTNMQAIKSIAIFLGIYISAMMVYFILEGPKMEWSSAEIAIVVAIIGVVGSILGNIFVNLKGWKECKKLIGNSSSNKTLTAMLGNDSSDRISLSGEHAEIKEKIRSQIDRISIINDKISEMKLNAEIEKEKDKERQNLLTSKQIDIGNTVEQINMLYKLLTHQNAEINQLKEQVVQLQDDKNKLQAKNQQLANAVASRQGRSHSLHL